MAKMKNHGTVRRRADGRWEARLFIGYDSEGKPKQRYFYGKTKHEVNEKLNLAIAEMRVG